MRAKKNIKSNATTKTTGKSKSRCSRSIRGHAKNRSGKGLLNTIIIKLPGELHVPTESLYEIGINIHTH